MSAIADAVALFQREGIVKLTQAFSFSPASPLHRWRDRVLGSLVDHSPGLTSPRPTRKARLSEVAPTFWELCVELLGGRNTVEPCWFTDATVANIGPFNPQGFGWHIDGDFFRHRLDSPEQALLIVVLWTDVTPNNGPTILAADSVPFVARYLMEKGSGCEQMEIPYREIVKACTSFRMLCGKAGDAFIMHPFMVHNSSPSRVPGIRLISNPVVQRKRPFGLENGGDCAVAALTVSALARLAD